MIHRTQRKRQLENLSFDVLTYVFKAHFGQCATWIYPNRIVETILDQEFGRRTSK
jgi:hypothetical protein